jgi:hypothetical protein
LKQPGGQPKPPTGGRKPYSPQATFAPPLH